MVGSCVEICRQSQAVLKITHSLCGLSWEDNAVLLRPANNLQYVTWNNKNSMVIPQLVVAQRSLDKLGGSLGMSNDQLRNICNMIYSDIMYRNGARHDIARHKFKD